MLEREHRADGDHHHHALFGETMGAHLDARDAVGTADLGPVVVAAVVVAVVGAVAAGLGPGRAAALDVLDSDPVLIVMPADHVVRDAEAFSRAVAAGVEHAVGGKVVTFGIVPDAPHTGFGYIRAGAAVDAQAFALDGFVEKPDRDTAESYLASGDYFWNSGIFVLRASRWVALIEKYRPDIASAVHDAYTKGQRDLDFYRVDPEAFADSPSDSIDYAVMEPLSAEAGECLVVPLDAGWSDIGAWSALWEVSPRDESGNAVHGDVVAFDAHDNLLHAQHRIVAVTARSAVNSARP